MHVGFLGSGLLGGKLGSIFARAGHDVIFGYTRSNGRLKQLARVAQGNARAGTPAEAAKDRETAYFSFWRKLSESGIRPAYLRRSRWLKA
jgi:predicted dinucleotide-binding enzyme